MNKESRSSGARRFRLDALPAVLCIVYALLVGLAVGLKFAPVRISPFPEDVQLSDAIQQRYGSPRYSNNREESLIRDYFQDARAGVFVDVGAYEWQRASNTYFLEHELGWSGLAIDVVTEYAEGYRKHRPRTTYITAFVDAVDGESRVVYVADKTPQMTSYVLNLAKRFASVSRELHVTSTKLDTLLQSHGVSRVDFLNMDIELGEPNALRGFSIDRYRPRLVCVEQHPPVRQAILDYFTSHGYSVVGKYLPLDADNLYFAPLPR